MQNSPSIPATPSPEQIRALSAALEHYTQTRAGMSIEMSFEPVDGAINDRIDVAESARVLIIGARYGLFWYLARYASEFMNAQTARSHRLPTGRRINIPEAHHELFREWQQLDPTGRKPPAQTLTGYLTIRPAVRPSRNSRLTTHLHPSQAPLRRRVH